MAFLTLSKAKSFFEKEAFKSVFVAGLVKSRKAAPHSVCVREMLSLFNLLCLTDFFMQKTECLKMLPDFESDFKSRRSQLAKFIPMAFML